MAKIGVTDMDLAKFNIKDPKLTGSFWYVESVQGKQYAFPRAKFSYDDIFDCFHPQTIGVLPVNMVAGTIIATDI